MQGRTPITPFPVAPHCRDVAARRRLPRKAKSCVGTLSCCWGCCPSDMYHVFSKVNPTEGREGKNGWYCVGAILRCICSCPQSSRQFQRVLSAHCVDHRFHLIVAGFRLVQPPHHAPIQCVNCLRQMFEESRFPARSGRYQGHRSAKRHIRSVSHSSMSECEN